MIKFKKVITTVCGVVILCGAVGTGVLAYTGGLSNMIHKTFTSPESYFQYITKNNSKSQIEATTEAYDKCLSMMDNEDSGGHLNMNIEIGDSLKPLIGLISPDLQKLKSADLDITASTNEKTQNMQVMASINDTKLATVNATVDAKNQTGYVQLPELTDAYLDLSDTIEEAYKKIDNELTASLSNISELKEALPDSKVLSDMLFSYTDIAIENIDDVKKSSATIKANGIEQKCTELKATLDSDYVYDVSKEYLNALLKDKDIKEIIKALDADAYDDFKLGITSTLDSLKASKDDLKDMDFDYELSLYVNFKGDVIGEKIVTKVQNQDFEITCFAPVKGSDLGFDLTFKSMNRELFNLEGKGSIKKDLLSGTFTLNVNDEIINELNIDEISSGDKLLIIKVKSINTKDIEKGLLNGSFEFSTDAVALASNYSIKADIKSTDEKATLALSLLSGKSKWVTISINADKGNALEEIKPDKKDKVYSVNDENEMEAFIQGIDIDKFVKSISDATGIEITEKDIADMIERFSGSASALPEDAEDDSTSNDLFDSTDDIDYPDYTVEDTTDFDWGEDDLDGDVDF